MQVIAVVLVVGLALVGIVVLAVSERPRRRHEGRRSGAAAEIAREQARAAAQVYQNHSGGI